MIKIYGIKNCDSVKKAIKFFKKYELNYEMIDFKQTPMDMDKISYWITNSSIDKLFNAKSTTYRNLNLKELNLSDEQKALWLEKENLLIKRPVVEYKDKVLVAFDESQYKKIILQKG